MTSNLERMIELATKTFEAHSDPRQLVVDKEILKQLHDLHPATRMERSDENGPYIWLIAIPTTSELMDRFLAKEIGEKELLDLTPRGIKYECLYLCSALTLPEYRNKGITRPLSVEQIDAIRKDHPIKTLFSWSFTNAGRKLADNVSAQRGLPLKIRS